MSTATRRRSSIRAFQLGTSIRSRRAPRTPLLNGMMFSQGPVRATGRLRRRPRRCELARPGRAAPRRSSVPPRHTRGPVWTNGQARPGKPLTSNVYSASTVVPAAVAVPLAKRILCLAEDREAMMSCAPASGGSRASRSRPTDMRDKTYQSATRSMVRGRCGSDRQGDVPACHWALR